VKEAGTYAKSGTPEIAGPARRTTRASRGGKRTSEDQACMERNELEGSESKLGAKLTSDRYRAFGLKGLEGGEVMGSFRPHSRS